MDPSTLDLLPLWAVGTSAQLRRAGSRVVKVAHGGPAGGRVRQEIHLLTQCTALGLPVVPVLAARSDGSAFVRPFLAGSTVAEQLAARRDDGVVPSDLVDAVWAAWRRFIPHLDAFARDGVVLDFTASNLVVRRGRVTLIDGGARLAPPLFTAATTRDDVGRALWAGVAAQRALAREPLPLALWPSGRLHVDVDVGPAVGGRLVWVNDALAHELGLGAWSRARLLRFVNWSTDAPRRTTTRPATRYRDSSPPASDAAGDTTGARGDGRAVSLGALDQRDPARRRELQLKGCGPTPLAWAGHAFHEDGRVSFPRALWEVTIAEELHRLGFESPRALCVVTTGRTTVDNTQERWPAAAWVRVSRTHLRVGHAVYAAALGVPLVDELWRVLRGARARPKQGAAAALVTNLARTLGRDVGRAYGLQIVAFNPTLGNVRVDGHLLDFSTVRCFRYHVPDFRFMEGTLSVRETRSGFRPVVAAFARALAPDDSTLVRAADASYGDAFIAGFLSGLDAFFDLDLPRRSPAQRRRLAWLLERVIDERAPDPDAVYDTGFFGQRPRAPLFDLAGTAPDLVAALRRRDPEPWRAALSPFAVGMPLSPRAHAAADGLIAALRPLVRRRPAGNPRVWDAVVRPFVEAPRLARLLYQAPASLDDDAAAWQGLLGAP